MLENLIQLGLGKNEAKAYVAAVELQVFSGGALAKRAGLKRPTAYLALDHLRELGLVSVSAKTKTRHYRVEPPQALKKLTRRMRRKTVEAELLLEGLLPELGALRHFSTSEPVVSYYEGMNGVKNVLLEVAAQKGSWLLFGSTSQLLSKFAKKDVAEILEEGDRLRVEAGLPKVRFITDKDIFSIPLFQGKLASREIKVLPQALEMSSALILTKDTLVLLNYVAPFAVVLQSKEVVDVVKLMYNLIWKQLPG